MREREEIDSPHAASLRYHQLAHSLQTWRMRTARRGRRPAARTRPPPLPLKPAHDSISPMHRRLHQPHQHPLPHRRRLRHRRHCLLLPRPPP